MNRIILVFALIVSPLVVCADQQAELWVENLTGYPVDVVYIAEGKTDYTKHTTIGIGEIMAQPVTPNFTWYFRVLRKDIGEYTTNTNAKQKVILNQALLDDAGIPEAPKQGKDTSGTKGSLLPPPLQEPTFTKPTGQPDALPPNFEPRAPVRGALVNWFDTVPEAIAILDKENKFLNFGENGLVNQVPSTADNTAKTTAAFLLQKIPGKKDTYHIQNIYYQDSFLYIDADAKENAPIHYGPEGEILPTGEWLVQKGQNYYSLINAANPSLRIGIRGNSAVVSAKTYGIDIPPNIAQLEASDEEKKTLAFEMADHTAYQSGDAFILFDVKSYRALLDMAPALVKWGKDLQALEDERKARKEAAEKAGRERQAVELERRRLLAVPEMAGGGGFGQENLSIRLGVGNVYETKDGYKAIKYTFSDIARPYLTADLQTSDNPEENQFMDLFINPKVAAWVQDKDLYIAIDTGKETSINLRHGNDKASSDLETDGNWYVGEVRFNLGTSESKDVIIYPTTQIKEVGAGRSSDQTKGINVSVDEIVGINIDETKGSQVNFQAREYEVSGQHVGDPRFGNLQYVWDSCGLADKPKSTEECTYEGPVDLFDKETLSLRKIKKIAQAMPGLETRTVYQARIPRSGLSSRQMVNFDVHVQAHMVKLLRTTRENTKNKDWNDFVAGFTYVFRPDLWDFNESFENQRIIKEARFKPVGFTFDKTFRIWLWIDIEDLKPFMKN